MKYTHLFALTLAAALSAAVPTFAQQQDDKAAEAPKAQEQAPMKDKAEKPAENDKAKADKKSEQEPAVKNDKAERHDAARMPQSDQEPAAQDREKEKGETHEAKGQPSDRDKQAHYQFKGDAKEKLRAHYQGEGGSHARNVTIVREQVLPVEVQSMIQPVPADMVAYLGPAPDGFAYGYADGFVFVYDPATFWVVDVIALW